MSPRTRATSIRAEETDELMHERADVPRRRGRAMPQASRDHRGARERGRERDDAADGTRGREACTVGGAPSLKFRRLARRPPPARLAPPPTPLLHGAQEWPPPPAAVSAEQANRGVNDALSLDLCRSFGNPTPRTMRLGTQRQGHWTVLPQKSTSGPCGPTFCQGCITFIAAQPLACATRHSQTQSSRQSPRRY